MIPILYGDQTESDFPYNGIGRLDEAISCVITEDLVGVYELELKYPAEGRYAHEIMMGGTIAALRPYADGNEYKRQVEPFNIYKTVIENNIITVNAHHFSYQLSDAVVIPYDSHTATDATKLSDAYNYLGYNSIGSDAYAYWNIAALDEVYGEFRIETVKSFREYLFDDTYSLKKIYNVDIWFRQYGIYFGTRGEDRGAEIRPGKNLADWSIEFDSSETYNAIVPYWYGPNTGGYLAVVSNPRIIKPTPEILPTIAKAVDFTNYFKEAPTQSALTSAATNYLNTVKPWEKYKHFEVGFYHDTVGADVIDLGDIVTVYLDSLDGNRTKVRIVSIKYDSIMERFTEIELGDPRNAYTVTSRDGLQATRNNMA